MRSQEKSNLPHFTGLLLGKCTKRAHYRNAANGHAGLPPPHHSITSSAARATKMAPSVFSGERPRNPITGNFCFPHAVSGDGTVPLAQAINSRRRILLPSRTRRNNVLCTDTSGRASACAVMPLYVPPLHAHRRQEHNRKRKTLALAVYFFCSGPTFCLVLVTVQ